jgi:hypothetical protein
VSPEQQSDEVEQAVPLAPQVGVMHTVGCSFEPLMSSTALHVVPEGQVGFDSEQNCKHTVPVPTFTQLRPRAHESVVPLTWQPSPWWPVPETGTQARLELPELVTYEHFSALAQFCWVRSHPARQLAASVFTSVSTHEVPVGQLGELMLQVPALLVHRPLLHTRPLQQSVDVAQLTPD